MNDVKMIYQLYGLIIQSDFLLAEAEEIHHEDSDVDVRIIRSPLKEIRHTDGGFRDFRITSEGDLFQFTGVGRFLVRNDSEIIVDLEPGFDECLIGLPLLGPVIAVLLHRRGHFILHGSSVIINGTAQVFLGDKGAGKSTTAAALVAAGYSMIADDVVAIINEPDQPLKVFPGPPTMKLSQTVLGHFPKNSGRVLEPDNGEFTGGKARFRLNQAHGFRPFILGRVHALSRGAENAIKDYTAVQTLNILIRFSYFPRLGPATHRANETARLFTKAAELADRIDAGRLTVADDLDVLHRLSDFLIKETSDATQGAK
ncbi:MAG: hypothetical protein V7676_04030 [Parasphingorhabdus sp.]|uniref:hypothetical protein n=1 Tax=Parasphingorhabdus sp. TaxID=2709688 RepID=UPI00300337F0